MNYIEESVGDYGYSNTESGTFLAGTKVEIVGGLDMVGLTNQ